MYMKRKIVFYIIIIFSLCKNTVFAQKDFLQLSLKNSFVRENLSEFYIEKIVDARSKKDTATLKKDIFNIEYQFEKSIEEEFLSLLDSAKIDDTKRHLILRINELRIQELDKTIGFVTLPSKITRAKINISFIEKIGNEYQVLFTASEIITRKKEEFTLVEVHNANIAKVFEQCNQKFVERLKANKLILMPILAKDTLAFDENRQEGRGLFEDFYDFKYNTIDTSRKFETIYKLSETENKYTATVKLNGDKPEPWGFRENGVSYVKMGKNKYFPLRKVEGKPSFFYEYQVKGKMKALTLEEVMPFIMLGIVSGVVLEFIVIAGVATGGSAVPIPIAAYSMPENREALFEINKNGTANFTSVPVDTVNRGFEWISLVNSPYSNEKLTYTVNGKQLCPLNSSEYTIHRLPKSTEKCYICVENEQKMKVCDSIQLKKAQRDIIFSKFKKDKPLQMKRLENYRDYNEVSNDIRIGVYTLRCPN